MQRKELKTLFPLNLQFFAGDGGEGSGDGAGTGTGTDGQGQQTQVPQFDYQKLADIISGKQTVAEDTILKNYFKQQGLSQDEMNQAISAFKQQKAANQPDVGALQAQVTQGQQALRAAQLENAATMEALGLGLDTKTIPYVLKMADMSNVMDEKGEINKETLKNALNKVLEDLPALKPQPAQGSGFVQVGAPGADGQSPSAVDAELDRIFGVQKK